MRKPQQRLAPVTEIDPLIVVGRGINRRLNDPVFPGGMALP